MIGSAERKAERAMDAAWATYKEAERATEAAWLDFQTASRTEQAASSLDESLLDRARSAAVHYRECVERQQEASDAYSEASRIWADVPAVKRFLERRAARG